MDRRSFIKVTAVGAGAGVASGAGLALQPSLLRYAPRQPLWVLTPTGFAILAAVAARTAGTPDIDPVTVAHDADAALRFVSPEAQAELEQVLTLLENGLTGLLLHGHLRPFTTLDAEAQDRALTRWLDSRWATVRGAGQALRKLTLGSAYAALPNALATGYPGPLFDKPDPGAIEARQPLSDPFVPRPAADPSAPAESGPGPEVLR